MQPYSQDLRERVVRACDEGRGTRQQIADLFGVSTAWIRRLLQRRRQTGSFAAKPHAGGPLPKMDPDRRQRLAVLVTQQPDATLAELRNRLGAAVHISTIARALTRLDLTVKKKSCTPPSRTARTSGTSGPPSAAGRRGSTRAGSSSSTRRGSTRP
jgi:putative transposase